MSKTILITGASTGIGAETARYLAKDNIIIVHYNASKTAAETVAQDVQKAGGQAHLIQADVTSNASCTSLVESVSQDFDHLDVLVNNAGGIYHRHPITDGFEWEFMEKLFAW